MDIATGKTISESSYEYVGEVAECKGGGGGSTTSVDKAYNARMAKIAEAQQGIAEEYFDFWKSDYKPYEAAQVKANLGLIPAQTGLRTEEISAARELLPSQTAFQKEQIGAGRELLGLKMPVARKYFDAAQKGVSVSDEMGRARADIAQAYKGTAGTFRREMGRMGVDPSSGRFASLRGKQSRAKAAALVGAGTGARRYAEEKTFQRLKGAGGGL